MLVPASRRLLQPVDDLLLCLRILSRQGPPHNDALDRLCQYSRQEPPRGVYSGMIPCSNNHSSRSGVRCPAKLSYTSRMRNGGREGLREGWPSHVSHWAYSGRWLSRGSVSLGCFFSISASTSQSWALSQECRTTLVTRSDAFSPNLSRRGAQ